MRRKNFEIIVGLFVVVVLLTLGWLTTKMGKFSLNKKPTYTLYAAFNDVSGLDANTRVKVAGVDIGFVKAIGLRNGKAVVQLAIYKRYKIPKDSIAMVKSKSLLGEKYLEIRFGRSNEYLQDGQFIAKTVSPTDIGTLISNINKVFNQQNRENISQALRRINQLTESLNGVIKENREAIKMAIQQAKTAMDNFNKSMEVLKQIIQENRKDVRLAVENARKSMQELNKTLDNIYFMTASIREGKGTLGKLVTDKELYENLNLTASNIKNITGKINSGKGTLGKLINDESVYNNLNDTLKYLKRYMTKANRIMVNITAKTEYLPRNSDSKGYITADIYTMPDKFYRIGLVNEKNYKSTAHPSGEDSNKMRMIAEMGKRYYNFVLRGGIMESTFGVGLDYYAMHDRLKFSADLFDFNHTNDIRDHNAQLKAQISYRFLRHFSIFGGVNEILNSRSRSVYLGGGIEFSNDDLKYFMDKIPTSSLK